MTSGFIININLNLLFLCSMATAGRAKGQRGSTSGSKRSATAAAITAADGLGTHDSNVPETFKRSYKHQQTFFPECRTVSIGYQHLVQELLNDRFTPQQTSSLAFAAASTTSSSTPQSMPGPKLMSEEACYTTCKTGIEAFRDQLSQGMRSYKQPAPCWATADFTIVDRNGTAIKQYCPGVCPLLVVCMCQLSLIIHYHYNATPGEMQRNKEVFLYSYKPTNFRSVCDMRTFPNDLGGVMFEGPRTLKVKRSLFNLWKLIPGSAKVLKTIECPILNDRQANDPSNAGQGTVTAENPAAKNPKRAIREVCYCNGVDGKRSIVTAQCSHAQVSCVTTSYEDVLSALQQGNYDQAMLGICVEVFPELVALFKPIPRMAIANEQIGSGTLDLFIPNLQNLPDLNELPPAEGRVSHGQLGTGEGLLPSPPALENAFVRVRPQHGHGLTGRIKARTCELSRHPGEKVGLPGSSGHISPLVRVRPRRGHGQTSRM
ncbi:hypothetical protein BCR37DRAFT_414058 [Protomyces lactucae-debilis]|uniref:Uncharacterized protein n=1 Tax=Protomyces lactucae-debilis TaxID=2754530 RepID=A0A1Y2FA60_PROLT|nr:uncharacterized protein BCR37DRAFT_414058 [Protomyces lactucae-debilis]ORY80810.1 hypothetical protein BCR37DRAFT_414058 [Protomyces lactucae-debilis]